MRIFIFTVLVTFLFQACSFKSAQNQWKYDSASAFNSYSKNFLTDKEDFADDDLQRAINYAKQSANLEQLARIYLGKCALSLSVGIKDDCQDYKLLDGLVESKELNAYFMMIQNKISKEEIENLPSQYKSFSQYKVEGKFNLAFETIKEMEQVSSQFIASSLIKNNLKKSQVEYLLDRASFFGYRKLVLFWLEHLITLEDRKQEKEKLEKKLQILKN